MDPLVHVLNRAIFQRLPSSPAGRAPWGRSLVGRGDDTCLGDSGIGCLVARPDNVHTRGVAVEPACHQVLRVFWQQRGRPVRKECKVSYMLTATRARRCSLPHMRDAGLGWRSN